MINAQIFADVLNIDVINFNTPSIVRNLHNAALA